MALSAIAWAPLAAEELATPPASSPQFELTRGVRQALARLQEHWLQWNAAFVQDNSARGAEATRQILATARQVGFSRVEDLSRGAAARAIEAATEGNWLQARWALESAEALDADQSATSVAGVIAAWRAGRYRELMGFAWEAVRRLGTEPHRELYAAELRLWLLLWWWGSGAAWVVVSVAVWGRALVEDLHALLLPRLPSWLARGAILLFLGFPLLLPGGATWFLLWLSIWLWSYHTRLGKGFVAIFWLAVAIVPGTVDRLRARLELLSQPPVRAFQAFAQNRLYGNFLTDLQVLRSALPNEPVVLELVADVHRTLGQWELARDFYTRVLEREPTNAFALLNLGGYFFRKGDFGRAVTFYQKAADAVPESAAAQFNLSMAYSDNYLFDDAREALERARQLDTDAVVGWIRTPPPERVLTFNGSQARQRELEALLLTNRRPTATTTSDWSELAPKVVPAVSAGVAALLAAGVALWWRARELKRPSFHWELPAGGGIGRFLPPVTWLARGWSLAAMGSLLLLMGLALLPRLGGMLWGMAWGGYQPTSFLLSGVSVLLMVIVGVWAGLRNRKA